jgi:hypothetical protein
MLRSVFRSSRATRLTANGAARYCELAALAGRWRTLLVGASPLLPSTIAPSSGAGWAAADLDELSARVTAWLADAGTARDALTIARASMAGTADADAAVSALVAWLDSLADLGVRNAVCAGLPADDDALAELLSQAAGVQEILDTALASTLPALPPDAGPSEARQWYGAAADLVRSIVGDPMVLIPVVDLGDLAAAFTAGNRPDHTAPVAVADWLREVGRVRPVTASLTEALVAGELLAAAAPPVQVTQAPVAAGTAWIATGRGPDDGPFSAGGTTCVLAGPAPTGSTAAGLVLDAWSEALPRSPRPGHSPEEVAGIAFHYDRPDARAPQALLVAVPPDPDRGWREEDVHGIVLDTASLATLRTLDLVDLPELRAILPPTGLGQ